MLSKQNHKQNLINHERKKKHKVFLMLQAEYLEMLEEDIFDISSTVVNIIEVSGLYKITSFCI